MCHMVNSHHACVSSQVIFHTLKMQEMDRRQREIRRMVRDGLTHGQISRYLRAVTRTVRGLSSRNVRRFCLSRGIHYRSRLTASSLDRIVHSRVSQVGHSYGRRTLHGLLRSEGLHVSQQRIGDSLRHLFPQAHHQRASTMAAHINPVPYTASYFGEKLHFDQNEKLNMYGVIHVLAVDGFSRKLVGFITLPSKNPILIYRLLYRPILEQYGLWDQLRMDHGTEFTLIVSVQQSISRFRNDPSRHPVLQSMSRQNHRAERMWPEINARINYPIKRILVQMEGDGYIDMNDDVVKFSVSWVTIRVVATPVQRFISAWNAHTIPGNRGGIPNILARTSSRVACIQPLQIPTVNEAVRNHGGQLTREACFGRDPIADYGGLQALRERDFILVFPSMDAVFEDVLHGNGDLLKQAIFHFRDLNFRYATLVQH